HGRKDERVCDLGRHPTWHQKLNQRPAVCLASRSRRSLAMPNGTRSRQSSPGRKEKMSERLVPVPHLIKSIRARNWSLAGALEGLVDNGIGHGRANRIEIKIYPGSIVVYDNGIGIDDINRFYRLGDAGAYGDLGQIGQYGVGAKHATIYLGDKIAVETVHKGRIHTKTVDWAEVELTGLWPLKYNSVGRPSGAKGTRIKITDVARNFSLPSSEKAARDFGQIFAPALRAGVTIQLTHGAQQIPVEPYTPPDLTDVIEIGGSIDTKKHGPLRWTGRAGLSVSLPDRFNAVHVAFGHR